jgi:crotonobetainyl-CoA:carnitine CoA-transferase CaiB-like acyl-CoA transferase
VAGASRHASTSSSGAIDAASEAATGTRPVECRLVGPLAGIRVLELASGIAGPYCGRLLAGLGADVIKIEPAEGDWTRRDGPFPGDVPDPERSGLFLHLNTGKRGVLLPGADLAALFAGADVLLLAHQRRDLDAAGLDIEGLRTAHPGLVVANVTPFGLTGPYADFAGNELVCYALSGYAMLTGAPDRPPLKAWGHLVSYQAGGQAALGVVAALRARDRDGRGQLVDVSIMEAGTFLLGGVEQGAHFFGRVARRNGTRLLGFPPQHSYPSTIRPCKDGYVHVHSNNRHLDLLGALIDHPRLTDPEVLAAMMGHADEIDAIVDEWLSDKTREEAVAAAQALRLPFTEVRTPSEVLDDPHHRERGSFVTVDHPGAGKVLQPTGPIRLPASPWRDLPAPMLGQHTAEVAARPWPPRPASGLPVAGPGGRARPLAGIRVVDFTNAVAGPLASSLLAVLGADVIKVEAPGGRPRNAAGIAPRRDGSDERPWDRILSFNAFNHGKRSLALDVTRAEGRDLFLGLVRHADVVVQNFSPRVLPNLGLGFEVLAAANPAVILVSMPAFGLDGPYRDRGSYGPGVDAMSGLSHLTGYEDGPPMKPGNFFCDQNAAVLAAFATLCALRHRDRAGEGQHLELAMIEGEFQVLADAYLDVVFNGREPHRMGNDHPWMAPHGVFPSAGEDAWVAIAVETEAQFAALCRVIGCPDLATDARFARQRERHANRRLLDEPIAAWTRTRTHYEAQAVLQAAGVPAGAVLNSVELLADPHLAVRRGFEYVETPGVGPTPYPRPAFVLSGTPVPLETPGPAFGSANGFVLRDLLALDEGTIAALYAAGVVADEPVATGGH